MNTTTTTVAAGAIVAFGTWAQDKPLTIKIAIGTGGVALILSLIAQADEGLAQKFGMLVLLAAAFAYLPDIVKKLGLDK